MDSTKSTREIHAERLAQACLALGRFGYMSAADLGSVIYSSKSADRLGRRLAKALVEKGLALFKSTGIYSTNYYALTERGARLAMEWSGENYGTGKDRLKTVSAHRVAANKVCALAAQAGRKYTTEREIQKDVNNYAYFGKVPDTLIYDLWTDEQGTEFCDVEWIEVEASKRGGRDLQTLAEWIVTHVFKSYVGYLSRYRGDRFARVVLVIASPAARTIRARVLAAIAKIVCGNSAAEKWARDIAPYVIVDVDISQEINWPIFP